MALFGALSGPGIFGAQYFGKGDIEGVKNVFRIKLWAAIAIGIIGILVFLNFDEFLDMMMACVVNSKKEVSAYFEELGADMDGDIMEASEVFKLPDGRFLIVEG